MLSPLLLTEIWGGRRLGISALARETGITFCDIMEASSVDTAGLVTFINIASAGSLSAAARRLKITPMTATRRLVALEESLGVRLIHRTTRSVSLTPEGDAFLPFATAIIETEDAGRAMLAPSTEGATGLLRVTAPAAFGRKVIMPIVPGLLEANPGLSIDLEMTDSVVDIVGGGIDVAIRIAPLRDSGLIARRLALNPRLLCASPAYLDHGTPTTVEALANHECLALSGAAHWPFVLNGHERLVRVAGRFSASSIQGIHAACTSGVGLALLSAWDAQASLQTRELLIVTLEDAIPQELGIWALYPTTRQILPKLRSFIKHLERELAV